MNPNVDLYLEQGCMRCALGGTPQCKVHNWPEELIRLRAIALDCGLTEEIKWGVPCYTKGNKNILIVSAFKDYCAISFFKGALLKDTHNILDKPGENTRAARLIRFTDVRRVMELEPVIKAYINEAMAVEEAGLNVNFKESQELEYPEELQNRLDNDPMFKSAFEALTPGRQRGYVLFFSQPKQSKTRESRIEKCVPKIFEGRGVHER